MKFSLKIETKRKIRQIAYYQIIGALLGILIVIWTATKITHVTIELVIFYSIGTLAFAYSILCGQKLLKGEIQKALQLSTVNQIFQLFTFAILGFSFKFTAGINLGLGFDYTNSFLFAFSFQFSQFSMSFDSSSTEAILQINLVALYVLYLIETTKKKVKQELLLSDSLLPDESDQDILQTQKEVFL
ncbi:MAG TPA: hypothetical protein VKI61_04135 [Chitinophagaceae bacterium]|nr:hypothetical protein [Chitinophagaceae bacterium]